MILKKPSIEEKFFSPIFFYKNARTAFERLLNVLNKNKDLNLILPAYIGWSPNEGSGIYDPITSLKIKHEFYNMKKNLFIDLNDIRKKFKESSYKQAILIVHYFGYVDPNYEIICKEAKKNNIYVIEDSAHALYTEYIDNKCGLYADFIFYSLHKMLPLKYGGMLKVNNLDIVSEFNNEISNIYPFFYNYKRIADIRKENAKLIENKLKSCELIELLRPVNEFLYNTPQTYPILLKEISRYKVYLKMNEKGIGIISLYHTMIKPIQKGDYIKSNDISNRILNFPVHQDINFSEIEEACDIFLSVINEMEERN